VTVSGVALLSGDGLGDLAALLLRDRLALLDGGLDGNLSGDLAAVLPGDASALLLSNLTGGVAALGPWDGGAPGNGDGSWGLDWDLVADLAVDGPALTAISGATVSGVSTRAFLSWDRLAAFGVGGFVGGLLFVVALLFLDGRALLVGHRPVDSLALLLVRGAAGLLVLGLVAGGWDGSATLAVGGLALAGVDGLVDGVAPRCGA